jgi:3'(2'), 5'-bisphosphate nucleotidase
VAVAAGLHTSRLDGTPLRYNQADPRLPDLVVCRSRLSRSLLDAIATAIAGDAGDAVPDSGTGVSPISQGG